MSAKLVSSITNRPLLVFCETKKSRENSFRREGILSCRVCKLVFALCSKIISLSGAPKEIVCKACFVDYQLAVIGLIGILRNKASSEISFRRVGIISCRVCRPVFALCSKIIFVSGAPKEIVCEPCFADYQSAVIGILRNKASSEISFRREGIISCRICKPVFALPSKIISLSGAPKVIVCEVCFVDYQSAVIGILRNKKSRENSFQRDGIISLRVCKPVFALSSKIIFLSGAPKEIVCKACFVDYQSAVIGILKRTTRFMNLRKAIEDTRGRTTG